MTGLDPLLLWPALAALNLAAIAGLLAGELVHRARARRARRNAEALAVRTAELEDAVRDGLLPSESDGLEHLIREIERRGGNVPPAARTRHSAGAPRMERTA